jgi:hypothetical protein
MPSSGIFLTQCGARAENQNRRLTRKVLDLLMWTGADEELIELRPNTLQANHPISAGAMRGAPYGNLHLIGGPIPPADPGVRRL